MPSKSNAKSRHARLVEKHRQRRVQAAETKHKPMGANEDVKTRFTASTSAAPSGVDLEEFSLKGMGLSDETPACLICEECDSLANLVACAVCDRTWHRKCLSLASGEPVDDFLCTDCSYEMTGEGCCHRCQGDLDCGNELTRCSTPSCPHLYHAECLVLSDSAKELEPGVCAAHHCHTCAAYRNVYVPKSVRIVECLYCPVAYHSHDDCIPAGTESINSSYIICPAHLDPPQPHYNAPYCLLCSKHDASEQLLCCDKCPASAHMSCLKLTKRPDGPYVCESCSRGRRLLYGDIVYVKMGPYRIVPPAEIHTRISRLSHSARQFCVLFYPKTQGYHWTDQLHTFRIDVNDTVLSKDQASYKEGMKEALDDLRKLMLERVSRATKHPPKYHPIKRNVYVDIAPKRMNDEDEDAGCVCTAEEACRDVSCLMREKHYECSKATCPVSSVCENQRFTRCLNAPTRLVHTVDRGWGLLAAKDIEKGCFIAEYCGEVISRKKLAERLEQKHLDGDCHFYFLSLDAKRVIDAEPKGNISRFINHSCDPNCHAEIWTVNRIQRVGIFAIRDIPAGAEITFNYGMKYDDNSIRIACKCGASRCKQFIGGNANNDTDVSAKAKLPSSKKPPKRRSLKPRRVEDDECFHCGDGGQLVMCDFGNCPRGYHEECLPPDEQRKRKKWFCPWHFCDLCEKQAQALCAMCSNSFCAKHAGGAIALQLDGRWICDEHDEFVKSAAPLEFSGLPSQRDQLLALVTLRRMQQTANRPPLSRSSSIQSSSTQHSDTPTASLLKGKSNVTSASSSDSEYKPSSRDLLTVDTSSTSNTVVPEKRGRGRPRKTDSPKDIRPLASNNSAATSQVQERPKSADNMVTKDKKPRSSTPSSLTV